VIVSRTTLFGGEEQVLQPAVLEALESLHRADVILVAWVEQSDEEAGVDEDHLCL
jgi:hypothetical protein